MEIKGIVRDLPRIQIREIEPPKWLQPNAPTENAPYADFGAMLREVIGQVNDAQQHAADLAERFARGEPVDEQTGAGNGARQPRLPTNPAGAQQGAGSVSRDHAVAGVIAYAGRAESTTGTMGKSASHDANRTD